MNTIDFLEHVGQSARLYRADPSALARAMELAQLEPAAQLAISSANVARLHAVLNAKPNSCCLIEAVEESGDGDATRKR
jgi:hypothetical protein